MQLITAAYDAIETGTNKDDLLRFLHKIADCNLLSFRATTATTPTSNYCV